MCGRRASKLMIVWVVISNYCYCWNDLIAGVSSHGAWKCRVTRWQNYRPALINRTDEARPVWWNLALERMTNSLRHVAPKITVLVCANMTHRVLSGTFLLVSRNPLKSVATCLLGQLAVDTIQQAFHRKNIAKLSGVDFSFDVTELQINKKNARAFSVNYIRL